MKYRHEVPKTHTLNMLPKSYPAQTHTLSDTQNAFHVINTLVEYLVVLKCWVECKMINS